MLIWHPKVHELFNERLHYYLLTVRPYNVEEFKKKIDQFQKDAEIGGLYHYEVFGAFDVVLRVWLPADMEDQFLQKLINAIPEIDRHFPFRVTDIDTYWCREEQLTAFKDGALDQVSVRDIRSIQGGTTTDTAKFTELGVLTSMEPTTDIKFFIFLSNPQPIARSAEEQFRSKLTEILKQYKAPANVRRESVYFGFGFAWALIKAETTPANYFVVGSMVDALLRELRPFGFHTNTYLATRHQHFQSDDISASSLRKAEGFDLLSARLLPDLYKRDVDSELRGQIIKWIHDHREIEALENSQRYLVTRCLAGVVAQDERIILSTLQEFFVDQERFLRSHWQRFLRIRLPSEQPKEVLRGAGIREGISTKMFAFGELCNIFAQIIARSSTGADDSIQQLTRDWQDVANLRNVVAHGACEPLREWPEMLTTLMSSFGKLRSLRSVIERALASESRSDGTVNQP